MMINNFEQIKKLLVFDSEDDFYFAQILKRKKEHPELGSNSYVVKTYYITSLEQLDFYTSEMICLANHHNARVGINLNRRSFENIAFHTLSKIAHQLDNRDYKSIKKAYNSVCGSFSKEKEKKWILDIDEPVVSPSMLAFVEYHCKPICLPAYDGAGMILDYKSKIKAIIPTKNGFHVITSPFELNTFKEKYPSIEVHKDNPTIIYVP